MSNLFDLSSEVAVVIGATGVLGGALAEGLAGAGAKVAILGRNAERGKKAVDEIRTTGGRADFIPSEFRGADSAREVARKAIELGNGHLQKHRANSGSPNSR